MPFPDNSNAKQVLADVNQIINDLLAAQSDINNAINGITQMGSNVAPVTMALLQSSKTSVDSMVQSFNQLAAVKSEDSDLIS